MFYVVFYDITDSNLRQKVASFLKSRGLRRVQLSVFVGEMNSSTLKDVKSGLSRLHRTSQEGERFSVMIVPTTESLFSKRVSIPSEGVEDDKVIW
ncbi:CRISPR-associated endonuclease Cas2 [Sulfuracidifex tepidarius]|uniref:CRISPR-associated endoribonuclease Cas2 n=1 Tax=Sulfuracidifex tepidarius TaxID=1294262 RepID=A0A510DXK3_9CREN|nr:CRISPR-associated endonuclease Cas2 [Sulfuracidifex tepidarius]BBG24962.1 CRISPR-associated endoribonuclease Cas2 1 [Sulfuracidifex tepidarius]BBG27745.1 CRISPR-associated endoribonuclease Cas2 1 [Sulfuracidifex tepidarius]